MFAVKWLFIAWCLYTQHRAVAGADVRLYTGVNEPRPLVPNHGLVRHCQIDNFYRDSPKQVFLAGTTSFNSCCSGNFTGGKEIGWWFYPNGTEVPKIQEQFQWRFFTSRHHRIVFLYRRGGGASGIHRLDIPVSTAENETLYVGLYRMSDSANPRVTSMRFNLTSEYSVEFSLTCNSVGGPATNVTWTRDGDAVSGGNFTATRRLDDPVTAAYTLTLSVVGRQGGVYRCQVSKSGPGVTCDPVNSSMELEVKVANPPTGLTAVKEDEQKVKVSWTPPTGGNTVTGYQIFYQRNNSVIVNASVTQYVITDPEPNVTYPITMVALSEHLPSEVVGPVFPINITDGEKTWRYVVGGVLGGAGIIIAASAAVAILLFLRKTAKAKTSDSFERDNRWSAEMTYCAAYEGIQNSQQPEHVYELPLPARHHSDENIASGKSSVCGHDEIVQSIHKM